MDWIKLLDDHHIHYVTRGPNTKRGEVSVRCPWCGSDDPSEHLGINLGNEAWGCHRNQAHRGKRPQWLVAALLGVSNSQADLIIAQYNRPDPDTLESAIFALTAESEPPVKVTGELKLPPEARDIPPKGRFSDYLRSRGFDDPEQVVRYYNLKCATTGRWKDRIIIPVYDTDNKLVAWTGRAITRPVTAPRYLTSEGNAIKQTVFNAQFINAGNVLFIVEGPLDAIKLDYYAYQCGDGFLAVGVFGTSITPDQIAILKQASKNYDKTVILLDTDAIESTFNLSEWISSGIIGYLPQGVKDPGDLTADQVKNLIKQFASR